MKTAVLPPTTEKSLPAEFFARPALTVARQMLGKSLVRQVGGETTAVVITEVEAYIGPHDLACHARVGRTPRTAVMYGPPGCWYVYLCYGMHWMLNIVTDAEGYPAAVLLRGAGHFTGPGKLTKALGIDRQFNGQAATTETGLWIADTGVRVPRGKIIRTPRIGIDYAGEWKDKPYRFVLNSILAKRFNTETLRHGE